MIYTLEELPKAVFSKVYEVYDIFINHFGEQYVDLQGLPDGTFLLPKHVVEALSTTDINDAHIKDMQEVWKTTVATIMVHWPTVTVTNENGKSIVIQDLYVKVNVTTEGTIPYEYHGFTMNRATYPWIQYQRRYVHSHLPGLDRHQPQRFEQPCLGSGPIRNTIVNLKNNCDEAFWMLFCQELSMYVTVESLTGGPYMRLEEIGRYGRCAQNDYQTFNSSYNYALSSFTHAFPKPWIEGFVAYYLENGHLTLKYADGKYQAGMPYQQFMLDISNAFIEYHNNSPLHDRKPLEMLLHKKILINYAVIQGKFYDANGNDAFVTDTISGRVICEFKGNPVRCRVLPREPQEGIQTTLILNHDLAMVILKNILQVINFRYKNERNTRNNNRQETTSTYQTVLYI